MSAFWTPDDYRRRANVILGGLLAQARGVLTLPNPEPETLDALLTVLLENGRQALPLAREIVLFQMHREYPPDEVKLMRGACEALARGEDLHRNRNRQSTAERASWILGILNLGNETNLSPPPGDAPADYAYHSNGIVLASLIRRQLREQIPTMTWVGDNDCSAILQQQFMACLQRGNSLETMEKVLEESVRAFSECSDLVVSDVLPVFKNPLKKCRDLSRLRAFSAEEVDAMGYLLAESQTVRMESIMGNIVGSMHR